MRKLSTLIAITVVLVVAVPALGQELVGRTFWCSTIGIVGKAGPEALSELEKLWEIHAALDSHERWNLYRTVCLGKSSSPIRVVSYKPVYIEPGYYIEYETHGGKREQRWVHPEEIKQAIASGILLSYDPIARKIVTDKDPLRAQVP